MLLPGGRWLLTANSGDHNVSQLCCWDVEDMTKAPAILTMRKRLAVFDELEASPVVSAQSDIDNERAVIMVRTCNYDGE